MLYRIFLCADERRLRTLWRLIGFSLIYIFFNFFFGGALFIINGILKQKFTFYILIVATFLGTCLAIYYARRFLDRRSFFSLGLSWNSLAVKDLIFGFLLTGLIMGLIYFIEGKAGWLYFEGFNWDSTSFTKGILGIVVMFILFILVGLHEELLYRGYVLQNLADGINLFWGFLISSLVFSLNHYANPSFSIWAFMGLFISGLFLAFPYLRTRQLWLSFGLHIGWNFFEGTIFGFQVSGLTDMPRLILQTVRGPEMVTGGEFGPEAGLVLLPALLLGTYLIYLYTRGRRKENKADASTPVKIPGDSIH